MKFKFAFLLALVLSETIQSGHCADSTNFSFSITRSSVSEDDIAAISSAHQEGLIRLFDLRATGGCSGIGVFVEGYKTGKATKFDQASMHSWGPQQDVLAKFCVCLETEKWPTLDMTRKVRGDHPLIPRTGTERLGFSFRIPADKSGQGGSLVVTNSDFDLFHAQVFDGKNLPFKIVNHSKTNLTVPIAAFFPRKFDINTLKGSVDALSLPDETIVVYAEIESGAKIER